MHARISVLLFAHVGALAGRFSLLLRTAGCLRCSHRAILPKPAAFRQVNIFSLLYFGSVSLR